MVDTTEALESEYLTADLVKNSPTKIIVIVGEGKYSDVEFDGKKSRRLTIPVDIDQKHKLWRPNRDSVSNMQEFGSDTMGWVGKQARLQIIKMQGKESIIAAPIVTMKKPAEIKQEEVKG